MTDRFRLIKPDGEVIELDNLKISIPTKADLFPVVGPTFKNKEGNPVNLTMDRKNPIINIKIPVKFKVHPHFYKFMDSLFRQSYKKYRHMWE